MAKRINTTVRNQNGNLVKLKEGEAIRKDGMLSYRYTDQHGKRHDIYSSTIEGLREKEETLNVDRANGLKPISKKLNDVFEEWVELKRGLRDHTMKNYTWLYDQYTRRSIGKAFIKRIDFREIRKFYNSLYENRGLAVSTIDGLQTVLRQVFDYAVKQNYIAVNPCIDAMKELKQAHNMGDQKHKALTQDEEDRFLEFLKTTPKYQHWYPVFTLMAETGMRVGEITGLRWDDIQGSTVSVNHTLVYYKDDESGKMVWGINPPKTKNGKRTIPLTERARKALDLEKEYQEDNHIQCRAIVDGYTGFVFTNKNGTNQHQGTLNRALQRIIRDANYDALERKDGTVLLPSFSCHNLRSTFCTRLAEAKVSLAVAMQLMGHSDSHTTLEVYTSVNDDWKRNEITKVEKMLQGNA